eukprot:7486618-Heterocapsa_arctica.AAC.1
MAVAPRRSPGRLVPRRWRLAAPGVAWPPTRVKSSLAGPLGLAAAAAGAASSGPASRGGRFGPTPSSARPGRAHQAEPRPRSPTGSGRRPRPHIPGPPGS